MEDFNDIRLKAFVVVGAVGVGVILLADFAHMILNQGIKRISVAKPGKRIRHMDPAIHSPLLK